MLTLIKLRKEICTKYKKSERTNIIIDKIEIIEECKSVWFLGHLCMQKIHQYLNPIIRITYQ